MSKRIIKHERGWIDEDGYLCIRRKRLIITNPDGREIEIDYKKYCPKQNTGDARFRFPCGDWCPLFGEPYQEGELHHRVKHPDGWIDEWDNETFYIDICDATIEMESFLDARGSSLWLRNA